MNAVIAMCHFCEQHGPRILFSTQAFHDDATGGDRSSLWSSSRPNTPCSGGSTYSSRGLPTSGEHCDGCRSIPVGRSGFISKDPGTGISYVSRQYPQHSEIYTIVRQACVRSISCEVCPGREGPIFFGDDHYGYVLSYTFYVKDSQARGLQRFYSVIVVMMDQLFLMNSWTFLVSNIKIVVDKIQSQAVAVFDRAMAEGSQKSVRLEAFGSFTPANFRYQRAAITTGRSLSVLTNDPNLFKFVHMSFTWLLKAGGSRVTEKLLEGPPTEDNLISAEKLREMMSSEGEADGCHDDEDDDDGTLKKLGEMDLAEFCVSCEHDPSPVDKTQPAFRSLHQLSGSLGRKKFHTLVHHVLIGNQVIVRCDFKTTVFSIIQLLQNLLPVGCCQIIPWSTRYEESYKCNFLGVPSSVEIPAHISKTEFYVLLHVATPVTDPTAGGSSPRKVPIFARPDQRPDDPSLRGLAFALSSVVELPPTPPEILTRIEETLRNPTLAGETFDSWLIGIREQWVHKAKVLYNFTKCGKRTDQEADRLFQVLGAVDEDRRVLKFWMTGLSSQYRSHLMSATQQKTEGAKTDGGRSDSGATPANE